MKRFIILNTLFCFALLGQAQGLHSLRLNEVQTQNCEGVVQEQGRQQAWIEIENTSYTTQNIGGCYLTNNPEVLNPNLTAAERQALMSPILTGDERTKIGPKSHFLIFADSQTQLGLTHASFTLAEGEPTFIALYEANGTVMIDSVWVPACPEPDASYAKVDGTWQWVAPGEASPNASNTQGGGSSDKVAEFKEKDPHGFAMTIMAIIIVIGSLALLAIFFSLFGWVMQKVTGKKTPAASQLQEAVTPQPVTTSAEEIDAVAIAMALADLSRDVHDIETGIITIRQRPTAWNNTNRSPLRITWGKNN